jgi:hypothetical protein
MQVELSNPQKCQRIWFSTKDQSEEPTEAELETGCPTKKISEPISVSEIRDHVYQFTAWFFDLEIESLHDELKLIDELEWDALVWISELPGDQVKYGRIGCHADGTGGISDRGLLAYLWTEYLENSLGMEVTWEPDDQNPIAALPRETLGDLIEVIAQILNSQGLLKGSICEEN